jgi:electron transfer flavoprotein alpha subunit
MSVLIFAEISNGKLKKPAFEATSYGAALASEHGLEVNAVVIGNIDASEAQQLANYGVANIFTINHPQLHTFQDAPYASAIADIAKAKGATFVILPQSYTGRAIAPRLAVKLDAALLSGINGLPKKGANGLHFMRTAYSGKAIQEVATSAGCCVITVKANAFNVTEHKVSANVQSYAYEPASKDFKLKVKETIRNSDKISLTEADVVVSAGRGLKGPENWGMIEELANLLGAATACSKPVADVHWRPHNEHVGQTGIQIAPNVYIAVGISGAIQHLAGVSSSKTIIVINKDPEAPFFKAADYGIVGDAFQVVPALTQAIKNRIGS